MQGWFNWDSRLAIPNCRIHLDAVQMGAEAFCKQRLVEPDLLTLFINVRISHSTLL